MPRIAVINDEEDLVNLLAEVLRLRNWDVSEFVGSQGVFEQLNQAPPDLVIVDIRMEQIDSGWHLIQMLRLSDKTRNVPIIVCSAATRDLQAKADWLHDRDILTLEKPFEIDDLYRVVERQLGRSGQLQVGPSVE